MSIKSDLTVLKTNIQNAKDKLFTNLTDKGVTSITTASTLDAMADSVEEIKSGGGNSFECIGYPSNPQYIQDGIDYAQTIYDNWDASITNRTHAFSGDTQLMFFPLVDTSNVTDMEYMFSACTKLQYIPPLITSNVKNMRLMFSSCSSLTSLDLSSFDTSNVTDMGSMFSSCSGLTSLDLSSFDTSNVTNMWSMFRECKKLASLDLSNFDTSNVTSMNYMFYQCSGLTSLDLSSFDTSKVTDMGGMFSDCNNLTLIDLSSFDTSNVTSMTSMFAYCSGLTSLDLSSFDTSNVTKMNGIFEKCNNLTRVDGYISFKSYSSSTMNQYYIVGYSSNSTLRKITFKDIGYNTNAKQFNMSYTTNWGVNSDTITDAKQSLIDSLITYSFDRANAGYSTCTVTLATKSKALLTDDEIAAITAKGFTIA